MLLVDPPCGIDSSCSETPMAETGKKMNRLARASKVAPDQARKQDEDDDINSDDDINVAKLAASAESNFLKVEGNKNEIVKKHKGRLERRMSQKTQRRNSVLKSLAVLDVDDTDDDYKPETNFQKTARARYMRRGSVTKHNLLSVGTRMDPTERSSVAGDESDYGSDYDSGLEDQESRKRRYLRRGSVTKYSLDASSNGMQPDHTPRNNLNMGSKARMPPVPSNDLPSDTRPLSASSGAAGSVPPLSRRKRTPAVAKAKKPKPVEQVGPRPGDDDYSVNLEDSGRYSSRSITVPDSDSEDDSDNDRKPQPKMDTKPPGRMPRRSTAKAGDKEKQPEPDTKPHGRLPRRRSMANAVVDEAEMYAKPEGTLESPTRSPVRMPRRGSVANAVVDEAAMYAEPQSPLRQTTSVHQPFNSPQHTGNGDLEEDSGHVRRKENGQDVSQTVSPPLTKSKQKKKPLEDDSGHIRKTWFTAKRRGSNSSLDSEVSDSSLEFGSESTSTAAREQNSRRAPRLPPSTISTKKTRPKALSPPKKATTKAKVHVGTTQNSPVRSEDGSSSRSSEEDSVAAAVVPEPVVKKPMGLVARVPLLGRVRQNKPKRNNSNSSVSSVSSAPERRPPSRTSSAKSSIKSKKPRAVPKKVRFGHLIITEFPIILGDNPAVTSGAPITMDWSPQHESSFSVNAYEQCKPRRRRRRKLLISVSNRAILLLAAGYSIDDIADASINAQQIKVERQQTLENQSWDRVNLMMENTGGAIGGIFQTTGKKLKQMMVKPMQHSETARTA